MHPLHQSRPSHFVDISAIKETLSNDKVAVRVMEKPWNPEAGKRVGVRLNLNLLKSTGKAVQTIHLGRQESKGYQSNKGFWHGTVLAYAEAVTLKNAYFNVNQMARELIATGQHTKFAMASVDGELQSLDEKANLDGVEVRFNPRQTHLFVDTNNQAIHYAEEVTIVGHRAYARGKIIYHTADSAPKRAGDAPTMAIINTEPDSNLNQNQKNKL